MPTVAGLILAAGGSSRFGQPKQLARFEGESLVRRAVRAVEEGGCTPVVLVVGNDRAEIEREVCDAPVTIISNDEWQQRGLGTSIRSGLQALLAAHPGLDSVVLLVCDQPLVHSGTIQSLVEAQETSGKPIAASSYANTLGVPALFDRSCFDALLALPDHSGAKPLIEARPADVVQVAFAKGAIDIDTPADLDLLIRPR